MSAPSIRMTKARKVSIAGIATAGAAAVTLSLVPGGATKAEAAPAQVPAAVSAAAVADRSEAVQAAVLKTGLEAQKNGFDAQVEAAVKQAVKVEADAAAAADAALKKAAADAAAKKAAAANAAKKRAAESQAATRSVAASAAKPAAKPKVYANNLDGWIREALDIMDKHEIPGSYNGLHRNIMRESSGNPKAINNWDINARNGIPSKGLLQVIQPTFNTYHVKGTPFDLYHPVANIVAAANYAADRYGSIDNVFGAY
ncbi:transglycosylase SLT domain-containing protein [Streptomyces sp. NPDC006798]|uniref:transglycosylase SLT domain-containing protein n=1 Tax=Streptomyces sp. NPDC006798 TaxID=3155462 RepID=UPI0033F2D5D3